MEKIQDVLQNIVEVDENNINEKWYDEQIRILNEYNGRTKRYYRYEIAEYLNAKNSELPEEGKPMTGEETPDSLCSRLTDIKSKIKERCKCKRQRKEGEWCKTQAPPFVCDDNNKDEAELLSCGDYASLYEFVGTLYDRIKIEAVRQGAIFQHEMLLNQQMEERANKALENAKIDSIAAIKNSERGLITQVVSVIGIFSAIMMGIFAALNAMGIGLSVFEGEMGNKYGFLLIVSVVTFFVVVVILVLLSLVAAIYMEPTEARKKLHTKSIIIAASINVLCIVGIIISLCNL